MRKPFITATTLCLLLLTPAHAQQSAHGVWPEGRGLSEFMTATQLQHIKLWFAGKFGNWRLAAYELDQIKASLGQAAMRVPKTASWELMEGTLSSLRKSIDEKDAAAFTKGYTELTHGCNACHRAAGRDFISVQIPLTSPFADQAFPDQVGEGRTLARTICAACHVILDQAKAAQAPTAAAPTAAGPSAVAPSVVAPSTVAPSTVAPSVVARGVVAPSFADLIGRPSFSDETLRQLLTSGHRRVGPDQAMLNPHLNEHQIEQIVAYFEVLRARQSQ